MAARILVAEDQVDIRDLIVLNLQQAGYAVTAVADGRAALDHELAQASELLVLDLMMPALDGLEVCKALRARGRATPILMLTTESSDQMKAQGRAAGATGWLVKPFDPTRLLEVVRKVIG